MNPLGKMMKRIKTPFRYALPWLFVAILVLIAISGSASLAATPTSPSASSVQTTQQAAVIPFLTFVATPTTGQTATFVGDSATHVYHYPSCSYAQKISQAHLVYFSSAAQAKAAGYRPCQHCNPLGP